MRFLLLAILLVAMPGAGLAGSGFHDTEASTVARLQAAGAVVIDVRRPEEWRETGVIPQSRLLTAFDGSGQLQPEFRETLLREIGPGDPIILVCRSGARSAAVGQLLTELDGYTHVYNLTGGMIEWRRLGYAVEPCTDC